MDCQKFCKQVEFGWFVTTEYAYDIRGWWTQFVGLAFEWWLTTRQLFTGISAEQEKKLFENICY